MEIWNTFPCGILFRMMNEGKKADRLDRFRVKGGLYVSML